MHRHTARGAMRRATPAIHYLTASGPWAVALLQRSASLLGGSGQCNSCSALPHRQRAVGNGTPAMRGPHSWGDGESCPSGGRYRKSAPPAMHCHTAWAQWAAQLLQCTAPLPGGIGQRTSCDAPPHCSGAAGSGTPAMHSLTALGLWAVLLLQYTALLPGGNGRWNSCNALHHCLGVVGTGTRAIHSLTTWGQWAVESLQCTASLPWGCWQWNSCNTQPHFFGEVGTGTPAIHCLTAWGDCGGRRCPTAWAHQPGGRGFLPRRRSVRMKGLRGIAVPNSPGSQAWGDGESCRGGGRCL